LSSPIDFFQELLGAGRRSAWRPNPALLGPLTLIAHLTENIAEEQHRRSGQDNHGDDGFHLKPLGSGVGRFLILDQLSSDS
jgi:hypothetical protein